MKHYKKAPKSNSLNGKEKGANYGLGLKGSGRKLKDTSKGKAY